jgi:hypothetical protein
MFPFTDINSTDPSKPEFYYIFIFGSLIFLLINYMISYAILNCNFWSNRRKSISLERGNLTDEEIINNYIDIYGEIIDMEIIKNFERKILSLRFRYLIAYLSCRASIWAKAPYTFLLFNKIHGMDIKEIGILYIIDGIIALIFGPIMGVLCDKYGRKLFCILYSCLTIASLSMRITGNIPLAYFSQILTGIGGGLINTTFESWINYEAEKDLNKGKKFFLEKLFKTQTILDSIISLIVTGVGAFIFTKFGVIAPILLAIFFSFIAIIFMVFLWDENKPNCYDE